MLDAKSIFLAQFFRVFGYTNVEVYNFYLYAESKQRIQDLVFLSQYFGFKFSYKFGLNSANKIQSNVLDDNLFLLHNNFTDVIFNKQEDRSLLNNNHIVDDSASSELTLTKNNLFHAYQSDEKLDSSVFMGMAFLIFLVDENNLSVSDAISMVNEKYGDFKGSELSKIINFITEKTNNNSLKNKFEEYQIDNVVFQKSHSAYQTEKEQSGIYF